ncbi:MAG TPA: hypothetical protein VK191_02405 [Symbiobacteriaceae bacterium]|nr:hypothetical protein [Symbiobacteriaceae bacterium]
MTYTTPELVTYGKVLNLTNGGGPGLAWECTDTGSVRAKYSYQCP